MVAPSTINQRKSMQEAREVSADQKPSTINESADQKDTKPSYAINSEA